MIINRNRGGGKETVTWHQCPEAVKLFLDEIEYAGYLTIVWKPSFGEASGTISYSSDNVAVSVSALDAGRANVVGSEITRGTNVTHATITATKNGVTKTLKVRLDNNPEYSNSTVMSCVGRTYAPTYVVAGNSKPVGKTVDGVTYYNEVPNEETPFASDNVAGTLKPLDKLRWLNTQVTTGTYYLRGNNVRDLGGWSCDGGTVKYGKIVRGGEVNPADKDLMVGEVGIRTEVSLLPTSKQQYTESAWDIDYVFNPTNTDFMYRTDISNPDIKTQWKLYLNTIFDSVSHSKPVFFHCGYGADKTGTISCVLMGILGVSLSDIQKDFELTTFAEGDTIGAMTVGRSRYMYLPFLLDRLAVYPLKPTLSDTFQNHCISFALDCETTIKQINDFRNICIDGTPTPIVEGHSVTNNLTQCSNSNPATSVSDGESYSGTITANSGYEMDSISVSMGGVDITSTAVSGNNITIANVIGDIIVTAIATQHQTVNILDIYGYHNDHRISLSSGNADKMVSATGNCATGQIPLLSGDIIRSVGFKSVLNQGHLVVAIFNSNKEYITGVNEFGVVDRNKTITANGVIYAYGTYNEDDTMQLTFTENANGCYLSFSGLCSDGANAIVTRNREEPPPYTNLADPNGGDWYNDYRQSNSSHGITANTGEQTTNTFPVGYHDIVRIKGLNGISALDVSLLYPTDGATTGAPSGGIIKDVWSYDSITGILTWTVSHSDIATNPYMRITFFTSGLVGTVNDLIITVNEDIV